MKKTVMTGLIAALVIGSAGFAVARGGPEGHGPRFNFEELDTNGDGQITAAEMEAHKAERFASQDTDGDGFLSKEELVAAMTQKIEESVAPRADKMLERKDADNDGQISLAELENNERPKSFFERLDKDGDGAISKEEMETMKKKRFGKRQGPESE